MHETRIVEALEFKRSSFRLILLVALLLLLLLERLTPLAEILADICVGLLAFLIEFSLLEIRLLDLNAVDFADRIDDQFLEVD